MPLATEHSALALERHEKRAVALSSVLAAALLVTLKTTVGLATHSLGVLSEAAHSGLDLVAAAITYLSVRLADKPADARHQYGHAKIENLSAFLQTGLLFVTCAWIVWEALRRLFYKEVHVEPTVWAFGVMALSIVIDFFRSRALARVARKYSSQALEADALHFRTDIWSSSVVIVGLLLVLLANRWGLSGLTHADPLAALTVAGFVVYISFRLGKRTVDVLLDAAPAGMHAEVEGAVAGVAGVLGVERVRTRRAGSRHFIDVTIAISRTTPFERVHAISDAVEEAIRARIPKCDVVVHMEPRAATTENLFDAIRAIAARHNLNVHHLAAHQVVSGEHRRPYVVVDLHLEVPENLTLRQAHSLASRIEQEVRQELPEIDTINTHMETHAAAIATADRLQELARTLQLHLADLCREFPEVRAFHALQVRTVEDQVVASCHCVLDGTQPITRVHDLTSELELRIKQRFPQLFRVTIHCEPPEAH